MARVTNPYGKARSEDNPYFTIVGEGVWTGWTWKVLKVNVGLKRAADPSEEFVSAFLATTSPHTYGASELGDGYIKNVPGLRRLLAQALVAQATGQPVPGA